MGLLPALRPLVALANRAPEPADQSMAAQRLAAARAMQLFGALVIKRGPAVGSVTDRMVPVPGGRIRVRIYRPSTSATLPLHVFIHGGGWCQGTVEERDPRGRALAADTPCVVASVDYRLAPENQYPTAPEDCYAALCRLVEEAPEFGADPTRVSVGGESAGGNLAAVVCLMARDRSGPRLVFQLLDIPATDLTMSHPSVAELGTGYLLTRSSMEAFVANYLPSPALATEPYVSPLHAASLDGLPPALVTTAEFDPLRDEGEAYAARLAAAGVPARTIRLAGHVHGSFAMTRLLASAREYHRTCVSALRSAYEPSTMTHA